MNQPLPRQRTQSLSLPKQHGRTLSACRGSLSAPDPLVARRAYPSRASLSRLSIVVGPFTSADNDKNAAVASRRNKAHQCGHGSLTRSNSARMSFASSSFSANSVPMSPRRRTNSMDSVLPKNMILGLSLDPVQVVETAKQTVGHHFTPYTSLSSCSTSSICELSGEVYLPFVDRPAEVAELISNGRNAKLLQLISHSLLPDDGGSLSLLSIKAPHLWSYAQFLFWLTAVNRSEVGDRPWVRMLRRVISPRSELMWERFKGMLGVPPELLLDDAPYDVGGRTSMSSIGIEAIGSQTSVGRFCIAVPEDGEMLGVTRRPTRGLRFSTSLSVPLAVRQELAVPSLLDRTLDRRRKCKGSPLNAVSRLPHRNSSLRFSSLRQDGKGSLHLIRLSK